MDNLDDSENNAKVSDSAYSNSCSNSQTRRSHSSKSTHSGSNSSGSSGYGGKPSSGSSTTLNQLPEKNTNEKEGKKKKKQKVQTELTQIQANVEFRLPDPAPVTVEKEEPHNAEPSSPVDTQSQKGPQMTMETGNENIDETTALCSTSQVPMLIVTSKSCTEGFSCVISMYDGVVLYMSSSLTATLGFPKDMWIGRSFIDFVHPLDHNTFASQITNGLTIPKKVNDMERAGKPQSLTTDDDNFQSPSDSVSTMFCRIRRFRGLETGFNVKQASISFVPFKLRLTFKNVCDDNGLIIYLVIQATPLFSAFKIPNEIVVNATPFVMRHVPSGYMEYIDNEAVPFLGYLPQDVNGQDVLKLYHPEDLAYVRHLYETIVKQGRASRSKPYRLMAQNGHYVKLETEWSSIVNPWSRKLQIVIGKHHIIEGPFNPDVFQAPPPNPTISEDDTDVEELKKSIVHILNEVPTRPAELARQQMAKRCQDLASFMESLIEDQPKVEEELRIEIQENDNSYYERDSVMLGGISPHHEYDDSKSSSGTPLSYNQLNFNINLKRYFDSHEDSMNEDLLKNADGNVATPQIDFSGDCVSLMCNESVEMVSHLSACMAYGEKLQSLHHEYQPTRLTELLLNKHNSEMEKMLVKKHRETRQLNKEDREKLSNEKKQKKKDHLIRCNTLFVPTVVNAPTPESPEFPRPHGQKRASKQSEAEAGTHKQQCTSPRQARRRQPSSPADAPTEDIITVSTSASTWQAGFVNGVNSFMPQPMSLMSHIPAVPGFIPLYYVPTAAPAIPCASEISAPNTAEAAQPFQAPPMQYVMYGQPVFGSPIMVSPFPVQQNVIHNQYAHIQNNVQLTTHNYEEAYSPALSVKPSSKSQVAAGREARRAAGAATASPPSSKMGQGRSNSSSICSATKALNRSTEAVPDSSVSRDSNMKTEETQDRTDVESSYSSFYSSFFKTESGSADDSGDAKRKNKNEGVSVTSELIYQYQVSTKNLDEVLIADKQKLDKLQQPELVNEQLGQLYLDLQLEGDAARLTLEEGVTSSGSSGEDSHKNLAMVALAKRTRRKRKYGKLVIIYEEDAPLPPPDEDCEPVPSTSDGHQLSKCTQCDGPFSGAYTLLDILSTDHKRRRFSTATKSRLFDRR